MKIKPLKILGRLVQIAAPVTAGVVAGPAAGAAVAAALGTGAIGKVAGKLVESKTGAKAQNVIAPASAVVGGAAAIAIDPALVDHICSLVAWVCENRVLVYSVPGLIAVLAHVLGSNVAQAGKAE